MRGNKRAAERVETPLHSAPRDAALLITLRDITSGHKVEVARMLNVKLPHSSREAATCVAAVTCLTVHESLPSPATVNVRTPVPSHIRS